MRKVFQRLVLYIQLVRLDKPIGIFLLLWPTLNALWIAAKGCPPWMILMIFILGTILMRSAGCAINDFADRDFDRHVKRTENRVLTAGKITPREALWVAAVLAIIALIGVLFLNRYTQLLACVAALIALTYPFMKRFFALPQAYLGLAFGFGIPMAFAAIQNHVPVLAWYLLLANVFWTLAYDTEYAMVDRDDDLTLGIRTAAITFGQYDVFIIMLCYAVMLLIYAGLSVYLHFNQWFWLAWCLAVVCAIYHYFLIRHRSREGCFKAFKHNHYLGAALFLGIFMQYL